MRGILKVHRGLLITVASIFLSSCGVNLLEYAASGKDSPQAKKEEARVLMDKKKYGEAYDILIGLTEDEKTDGNDVRILLAAATIGRSGFDIWSAIGEIVDDLDTKKNSVLEVLGSVTDDLFGIGEVKDERLDALDNAITFLLEAPNQEDDRVLNTACFLGGLFIVPLATDGTAAITALQSELNKVSGGQCEGTDLATPLADVSEISARLSRVFATVTECPDLGINLESAQGVNATFNRISTTADQGCDSSLMTPAVEAFLPSCAQEAAGIPNTSAQAQDNRIDSCELVIHCLPSSGSSGCF